MGVVTAMVLGIWMIDGWEVSASASEESTGPAETSGRGGIAGLLVTTAVLLGAMIAYLHVGSVDGFAAHQTDAMSYVASRLGGPVWSVTIVATVLVSTAATLWTTILYLSRSTFAMGRDGVLPLGLGKLDARGLPVNALYVVSGAVAAFTLLTGFWPTAASVLNLVLDGTSVFLGALFCLSALSALKLLSGSRKRFVSFGIPLFGAIALAAVIAVDVAQSDAVTRGIEIGGLVLGIPFAGWRARGLPRGHGKIVTS
jgi:amino acid transporter